MRMVSLTTWAMLAALWSAEAALADEHTPTDRLIERGRGVYMMYCSNCHGEDAKGNGPTGKLLKIPPSDLTMISRAGRPFSYSEIYRIIDGGKDVKGHGAREMPIWGDAFGGRRSLLLNELVHYLEDIQMNP